MFEDKFTKAVPKDILDGLSKSSEAKDCFVRQKFSRKLQTFLVDYSLRVQSVIPITFDTKNVKENIDGS